MRPTGVRSLALALVIVVALLAHPQTGAAQTGTFTGVVTADTLGHPVSRAEVMLPQLSRTTLANEQGEFRFNDVPAGRYAVTVRALGFQLLIDSVDIAAGRTLDGELTLLPVIAQLDSVRTTASLMPNVPPRLEEFAARQAAHISGYFLSDSALRRRDRDNLASVISMLPSVDNRGGTLASTHGGNTNGPIFQSGSGGVCLFTVYLDGVKIFQPGDRTSAPDFSKLHVEDYYGVEVYPSSAQLPAQYSTTGPNCGAILLWTRPGHHP